VEFQEGLAEPGYREGGSTSFWRRLGYGLGDAGLSFGSVPTNILFLYYLTEVVGVRAGLAGMAVALPKIWDALVDPMLGGWVDRLAMRIGRRAPIALISAAGFLAALFLMFSLPHFSSPWMVIAASTALLIVSSTTQTAFGVSQLALASDLTQGQTDLTSVLSTAAVMSLLFLVIGMTAVPLLIPWLGAGAEGYSGMSGVVAIVAAAAITTYSLSTWRVPVHRSRVAPSPTGFWTSIKATTQNNVFYYLIGFQVCYGIGAGIFASFLPFANQFVLSGDPKSLAALEGVGAVGAIAGLLIAPMLVRRFGPTNGIQMVNIAAAFSFVALFAASFGPIAASWLTVTMVGFCTGALGILLRTVLLDIAQRTLKNGLVPPLGLYLGILLAATKLGGSGGNFTVGELLDSIRFMPKLDHQSGPVILWLRLGYTLIPSLFFLVGGLFLLPVRRCRNSLALTDST
jgi:GPH family glycoside/pentoside/hexuronide:cation symporter